MPMTTAFHFNIINLIERPYVTGKLVGVNRVNTGISRLWTGWHDYNDNRIDRRKFQSRIIGLLPGRYAHIIGIFLITYTYTRFPFCSRWLNVMWSIEYRTIEVIQHLKRYTSLFRIKSSTSMSLYRNATITCLTRIVFIVRALINYDKPL